MLTLQRHGAADALRWFAQKPERDFDDYVVGVRPPQEAIFVVDKNGLSVVGASHLVAAGYGILSADRHIVTLTPLGVAEMQRLYPEWSGGCPPWWVGKHGYRPKPPAEVKENGTP